MILITGSNRGLGKSIANRLINNGEKVIGLSRSKESAEIETIECDVNDYDKIIELL